MEFLPILPDGTLAGPPAPLPEAAREALAATARMYESTPYRPPWISYLACDGERAEGICAFVGGPRDGAVEIAYHTFPGSEGRGVATAMARMLISIAQAADANVAVTAHTLPSPGASTRILQKLGFTHLGSVGHPVDGSIWRWRLQRSGPNLGGAGNPH